MYNYKKLLGRMKECGITQERLAEILEISPASLNKRLKNRAEFKQSEMKEAMHFLDVGMEHLEEYFFAS